MRSIYVPLPEGIAERLSRVARSEFRNPRDQATVLILEGLQRRGEHVELTSAERAATKAGRP